MDNNVYAYPHKGLDRHQNLTTCSFYHPGPFHNISSQSIDNFLINRQTNQRYWKYNLVGDKKKDERLQDITEHFLNPQTEFWFMSKAIMRVKMVHSVRNHKSVYSEFKHACDLPVADVQ